VELLSGALITLPLRDLSLSVLLTGRAKSQKMSCRAELIDPNAVFARTTDD
jgi:hypothetical protein